MRSNEREKKRVGRSVLQVIAPPAAATVTRSYGVEVGTGMRGGIKNMKRHLEYVTVNTCVLVAITKAFGSLTAVS